MPSRTAVGSRAHASTVEAMSEPEPPMDAARTRFALTVQHLLAEQGCSLDDLAGRAGYTRSQVSALMVGGAPLGDDDLARICRALEVTPAALLDRADRLGWASTQAAVAARLGRPAPAEPPRHNAAWWQALIDEALGGE